MSQIEDHSAENGELLQENFTRIFEYLELIYPISIRTENFVRQILAFLRADQDTEFDNRDLLEILMRARARQNAEISNNLRLENNQAENMDAPNESSSSSSLVAVNAEIQEDQPQTSNSARKTRKRKMSEIKNIYCSDCKQNFVKGDGNYTRHLKEVKCKPHECTVPGCDKRFRKKSYLNVHIASHSRTEGTPPKVRRTNAQKALAENVGLTVKSEEKEPSNEESFSVKHPYLDSSI